MGGVGDRRRSRRWIVFVHQDGIIVSTTVWALAELGILGASPAGERPLCALYPDVTPGGFGYLRVGLRCLASQGWLEDSPTGDPATTMIRWSATGRAVAPYLDRYVAAGRFLAGFDRREDDAWSHPWDPRQVESFVDLSRLACERWRLGPELADETRALVSTHLDATLVVPAMISLSETERLGDEGPSLPDDPLGEAIGRVLGTLGWVNDAGAWTSAGHEAASLSVHFGMAGSYLPMLARLPELFRGQVTVATDAGESEWHVQRRLNVLASATAHRRYFADANDLFLELFDREPANEQPRFVADLGCGDGSWLAHIYDLIMRRTLRGKLSEECPLLMVGIDYNLLALDQARRLLAASGIPALLIQGDVSDPDAVAVTLADHGLSMEDGLHIRAFIDHNRRYRGAEPEAGVRGVSSGAYVGPGGLSLDGAAVEGDLVAHLRRWAPHLAKHGLVALEAHCVEPSVAREHLGATHSVAFDGYHGYSHQYPVEHTAFRDCCRLAGLRFASEWERRYPVSRPFVAVTLSRLLPAGSGAELPARARAGAVPGGSWQPSAEAELADGKALHELLFTDGDLSHPRSWCSAPTGYVVAGALAAVEARLASARRGDVIRVLDYGAGTGLASIEFLKACRERRVEQRLDRLGATLEVHLVDLPSSWFAYGFELLRDCRWTRFHSLSAPGRRFRPLPEVTGGMKMDAVMANMVFHLVPRRALESMATGLAEVTAPGGCLVWSAPDIGPAGPHAVLFHDANRALRRRWLAFLDGDGAAADLVRGDSPAAHALREAIRRIRDGLNDAAKRDARTRANRRVLPEANVAQAVVDALASKFCGSAELKLETHELLVQDVVDTLLVPANQTEYLPEIADPAVREALIRELMLGDVLPALRAQGAGTAGGVNVQWTLGELVKSASVPQ
jgi:SAM-dependent methyltransferase